MSRLALFFLGSPRIELDDVPVELDRRKAVALLAYLAVTGREHSRDTLATLLWPEYDQSRARAALRRTLSVLDKALAGEWLNVDRQTIDLNRATDLWIDTEHFRSLVAECQEHDFPTTGGGSECLALLTQAADVYRDDFLAGFTLRDSPEFDEWQFFQAANLRRELIGALTQLVIGYAAQGEYASALDYARRWIKLDSLDETGQRWLMQLYAWTDQRSAALRQYQECVRNLDEELGVSPSEETTALYERIRAGESGRGSAAFSSASRPPAPLKLPPFLVSDRQPASAPTAVRPFVAREYQLAQLQDFLEMALVGQGRLALVTGEAGVGKTALVREFARRAQEKFSDLVVAVGNCNAYTGTGDPYLPFREILGLLAGDVESGWTRGLITRENALRLWSLLPVAGQTLVDCGPDLLTTFVSAAALATRVAYLEPDQAQWVAQIQRGQAFDDAAAVAQSDLFEQYAGVLQALAKERPLLLIVDDAQWADVASINLFFHLGRQLAGSRILLVVTCRPDDVALGRPSAGSGSRERHPLEPVVNELKRTHGEIQVELDQRPDRHFVEALLDTQPNRLGVEFRTALYEQTQGHPLFTVELLRSMQERGDIIRDKQGLWIEGTTLDWDTLPARVEAVIEERISRLDEGLRDILTVASVEGDLFTAQVVAQVQQLSDRQMLRSLSQSLARRHHLVREHGELKINGRILSRYQFSHTLFQQYLYNTLSAGERRLLHGDIAAALEEVYAERLDEVTVQLARHYARAGQAEQAIDYLLRAGDRARSLYAHQEAVDFYEQALALLKEQGAYDRAARTLMKLGLTYHLAFDFKQSRQAYSEGFTLWQRAGVSQFTSLPPAPHALRLVGSDPPTLDPGLAGDDTSGRLIDQLFSGLVELSPEMEVVPEVAHSWDVLEGGYKYIFHLRADMHWTDGTPVTAQDFEFAWKRVLHPGTNSPLATLLYDLKGARAYHQGQVSTPDQVGVRALDEVTLAVELEGPTGYFLQLLTVTYPVPRHVVEMYGDVWTAPEKIVTNGPFMLKSRTPRQLIVLARNPDYRGRFTGNVERVELGYWTDRHTELQLYEADRLDLSSLWFLSGGEIDRVRQRFADDYLSRPGLNTQYVGFNVRCSPFDDRRVRRAFVMAIDRETLADVVLGGYTLPATGGFIPPGIPGHSPEIGLPYDPEQARQLLAEAGFPGGRNFPGVEWWTPTATDVISDYLRAQWRENLGVDIPWQIYADASFYERLEQTKPHMFRIGWKADYPDPDNFLRVGMFLKETGWRNETYEGLVERARRITDQEERMKLYQQADRILIEEAVVLPYVYVVGHVLVKPWVTRYPTSPIKSAFWKDVIIEPH